MAADRARLRPPSMRSRGYAVILCALSLSFLLRVGGQALQRWAPQALLPPFAAFQGSRMPYGLLLASQVAILAVMASVCWRVWTGRLTPNRGTGRLLAWAGGLY